MTPDIIEHDLRDLNVPKEYYSLSLPKMQITRCIKESLEAKQLTVRKLAEYVGMKHPQIVRVTSGENYTIETLLKILDALDLEIVIQHKKG